MVRVRRRYSITGDVVRRLREEGAERGRGHSHPACKRQDSAASAWNCMVRGAMSGIVLDVCDYAGQRVVLTEEVFAAHVYSAAKGEADREFRRVALSFVPQVLKRPRFVYYNYDDPESTRLRYLDLAVMPDGKIKAVVVVVETSTAPWQIVTWLAMTKLKGERTNRGGVIFDGSQV